MNNIAFVSSLFISLEDELWWQVGITFGHLWKNVSSISNQRFWKRDSARNWCITASGIDEIAGTQQSEHNFLFLRSNRAHMQHNRKPGSYMKLRVLWTITCCEKSDVICRNGNNILYGPAEGNQGRDGGTIRRPKARHVACNESSVRIFHAKWSALTFRCITWFAIYSAYFISLSIICL